MVVLAHGPLPGEMSPQLSFAALALEVNTPIVARSFASGHHGGSFSSVSAGRPAGPI